MNVTANVLVLCLAACSAASPNGPTPGATGFDTAAEGEGWRFSSTGGEGPRATWQVRMDPSAVSPPNVMSLIAPNHKSQDRFNLCWSDDHKLVDGKVAVALRAERGDVD